jgi:hypothetical protein
MLIIHNETVLDYIHSLYDTTEVVALLQFLSQRGTFRFSSLENGLFPSVPSGGDDDPTGYKNAWVRDNVHIAHAHFIWGERLAAGKTARALMKFFEGQRPRMRRLINNPSLASNPMNRPHVRFNAVTMGDLCERWPHAQNDALGYFLWFFSKMGIEGVVNVHEDEFRILVDLVSYLGAIEFWKDHDSGHWEEQRKVSASSIGAVVAGLHEFARLCEHLRVSRSSKLAETGVADDDLAGLITKGEKALTSILPHESLDPMDTYKRRYDAALLFLIYPLEVVDPQTAAIILNDVVSVLEGEVGVRRYLGDSYWCSDYRELFGWGERSADFSENMQSRDQHLKKGEEAQWCLFDSLISCIYGMRVKTGHRCADDRKLQCHYLNRSIGQLMHDGSGSLALQCPEAYFLEKGSYVPNDHVPLQWAQANLRMAIHWLGLTTQR